jgi:hypothetical protein
LGSGENSKSKIPNLRFFPEETALKVPEMFNRLVYIYCGVWILAVLLVHENPEV